MTLSPLKILLTLLFTSVSCCVLGLVYFLFWLNSSFDVPAEYRKISLTKGSSLYAVADKFKSQNLISWPRLWSRYALLFNRANIKAGEYQLPEKVSPLSLLDILNSGDVIQHTVTLVEGTNFKEQLAVLQQQKGLQKTLLAFDDEQLVRELGLDISNLEGWFFPDTYSWIAGDSDSSILLRAHKKMQTVLEEEWNNRAENLPYKSPYEALIMASIVEKETGAAFEREMIAGVFVRRLQKGMRLQTDPTVIYGMGENYQGNITRKDLKTPTAYNTYVIRGLPPTPICMPGREAIYASLHPASGEALYFVAKGDGTHQFSTSLDEHNEAVKQFQLKRRQGYHSAPKKH